MDGPNLLKCCLVERKQPRKGKYQPINQVIKNARLYNSNTSSDFDSRPRRYNLMLRFLHKEVLLNSSKPYKAESKGKKRLFFHWSKTNV